MAQRKSGDEALLIFMEPGFRLVRQVQHMELDFLIYRLFCNGYFRREPLFLLTELWLQPHRFNESFSIFSLLFSSSIL